MKEKRFEFRQNKLEISKPVSISQTNKRLVMSPSEISV